MRKLAHAEAIGLLGISTTIASEEDIVKKLRRKDSAKCAEQGSAVYGSYYFKGS